MSVANTLSVIRKASHCSQLTYNCSKENPAYAVSRAMKITDFIVHHTWLEGPKFPWKSEQEQPEVSFDSMLEGDKSQVRKSANVNLTSVNALYRIGSSVTSLGSKVEEISCLAYQIKSIQLKCCRRRKITSESSQDGREIYPDLSQAKSAIVHYSQQQQFNEEIAGLAEKVVISKHSSI